MDNVKYTLKLNLMQLSISYCYSLGRHTPMIQYENKSQMAKWISAGFFSVMTLEIHWHREIWGPINRFNPDAFLCLSQARTWISNAIWHGYFFSSMIRYERWLFLFFKYCWNYWPSLFKYFVIKNLIKNINQMSPIQNWRRLIIYHRRTKYHRWCNG